MEPSTRHGDAGDEAAWLRERLLEAGAALTEAARHHRDTRIDHKGRVDLVTNVDLDVQDRIVGAIGRAFPGDRIVAEESTVADSPSDARVWYVDPLDGTTNFVHGHPFFAVSVALWSDGRPELGGVFAPLLDEFYLARSGSGATLERPLAGEPPVRIGASECASLDDALLGTGFPYHRGATARLNLAICARALARVQGLRRGGSAALDLCHVALGRLDGYWEMGLSPWDVAAGVLVAREAGARVSDFAGGDEVLRGRRVVAAGARLHGSLRDLIEAAHGQPDLEALGPMPPSPLPLTGPLPAELA